jgi:hypothetical protein
MGKKGNGHVVNWGCGVDYGVSCCCRIGVL